MSRAISRLHVEALAAMPLVCRVATRTRAALRGVASWCADVAWLAGAVRRP